MIIKEIKHKDGSSVKETTIEDRSIIGINVVARIIFVIPRTIKGVGSPPQIVGAGRVWKPGVVGSAVKTVARAHVHNAPLDIQFITGTSRANPHVA